MTETSKSPVRLVPSLKADFRNWPDGQSRVFRAIGFIMKYMRDSREKRAMEMTVGAHNEARERAGTPGTARAASPENG